ncbi:MAG TPA: prephenate dehydratase, partial [Candidatus Xenobia bacterium]
ADGVIIEVHQNPAEAYSDGPQSLYPKQLERVLRDVEAILPIVGRQLYRAARVAHLTETRGGAKKKDATLTIAYQGQAGAFSERAAHQFFGDTIRTQPSTAFRDVFSAVADGTVDYGVLPVENSLTGSIHQNFDLFSEFDVTIVGEVKLRIVHSLIAHPGTRLKDIDTVYAHPQASAQCDDFLRSHAEWKVINVYDTAGSVDHVKSHGLKKAAAIAGAAAASLYGMEVLQEGIESNPNNFTRFVVIGKPGASTGDADKTSIVFETKNEPGALVTVLQTCAQAGVNLVKLESRPIPGQPWHYLFYADLQTATSDPKWAGLQAALQDQTHELRVLGSYRAA